MCTYACVCVSVIIYILSYFCIIEERIWKIWKSAINRVEAATIILILVPRFGRRHSVFSCRPQSDCVCWSKICRVYAAAAAVFWCYNCQYPSKQSGYSSPTRLSLAPSIDLYIHDKSITPLSHSFHLINSQRLCSIIYTNARTKANIIIWFLFIYLFIYFYLCRKWHWWNFKALFHWNDSHFVIKYDKIIAGFGRCVYTILYRNFWFSNRFSQCADTMAMKLFAWLMCQNWTKN